MDIIVGARQCGKTVRMIEEIRKNKDAVLIVFSEEEKRRLIHRYTTYKRNNVKVCGFQDRIISVGKLKSHHIGHFDPGTQFYVDNADILLENFLGVGILKASLTGRCEHIQIMGN